MIYLDYAATTPLDPNVLKKMSPFFSGHFANPASIHSPGQEALKAVEDARYTIADVLHVRGTELVFTSGATEANNLALQGLAMSLKLKGDKRNEVITSAIEHDSILEPLHRLEQFGFVIKKLPVQKNGLIKKEILRKAINEKTLLVTIGLVNSEIGVIQPIAEFGRLIKKYNERVYKEWLTTSPRHRGVKPGHVYFHTDATQAVNCLEINIQKLKVDLLSLSAHKIYGPKGIGLLYVKRDTPVQALQYGGHQERNIRSGTLNVPGIIGLTAALQLAAVRRKKFNSKLAKLRKQFITELKKNIPAAVVVSELSVCLPSHINILFPGVAGDALLVALDEKGVAVSTGSACASGNLSASHVIAALGFNETMARSALRFTLGHMTTAAQLLTVSKLIKEAYQRCLKRFEKS